MNTHEFEDIKMQITQLSQVLFTKKCQLSSLEKIGKVGFINSVSDDVKKDAQAQNFSLNLGQIYTDEIEKLNEDIYQLTIQIENLNRDCRKDI
ncbi:hypothetical protein ACYQIL_001291 [Acinetobacter baumannii]|uniref:hypothetical protein n=1 Tax=Acinetobacter baumannii TaxID=470 RepID=UPI0007F8AF50|nr:hypothetical protein [Acinetobacter baumannii]ELA7050085.1 hypothetical protein [Acinetobacter baumannii]OBM18125.1 hypothetical protein A9933_05135 [Acinetobacter baumannii]